MGYFESRKGDGFKVVTWRDGTDAEIAAMLKAHYKGDIDIHDYWSVGDMRTVSLSAMEATGGIGESHVAQNVVFILSNIGGKILADGVTTCAFQVDQKDCLNETGYMNNTVMNSGGWEYCKRRTWCNEVYKNAIPSTLRSIFKEFINQSGTGRSSTSGVVNTTDTFALRAESEVLSSRSHSVNREGSQVTLYKTSSNRIKRVNYTKNNWWLRSPETGEDRYYCYIYTDGNSSSGYSYNNYGIAPFGVI